MEDSFAKYRDTSKNSDSDENILTDDDDVSKHSGSTPSNSLDSADSQDDSVVIPESSDENENEESIVVPKNKNKSKKVARIESDSEEERFERQNVISPRTRRSITTRFQLESSSEDDGDPEDIFDRSHQSTKTQSRHVILKNKNLIESSCDEGDIETSNNSIVAKSILSDDDPEDSLDCTHDSVQTKSRQASSKIKILNKFNSDEENIETFNSSTVSNKLQPDDDSVDNELSGFEKENNFSTKDLNSTSIHSHFSTPKHSMGKSTKFNSYGGNNHNETSLHESNSINLTGPHISIPLNNSSANGPERKSRLSTNFNKSIEQKLSSTVHDESLFKIQENENHSIDLTGQFFPKIKDVINISSELESPEIELIRPTTSKNSSTSPTSSRNVRQPKISAAIKQPFSYKTAKTVSREFLNFELRKLEEKKLELITCNNLCKNTTNLPDGGKKMFERIENLKLDIKKHSNEIANLVVDENEISNRLSGSSRNNSAGVTSWTELSEAVNAVEPKYTGKVGMANFVASKAMTIDRLKDIHQSLETCPNESVLADDPDGLKVNLMPHQKHALAWMKWREFQKPRGGILADDMGLGKTLTMIAHVLAFKYEKENCSGHDGSGCDSNEDEAKPSGWSAKGRKDYKDGGTLVVCPASLIRQWESEVHNKVKKNILTVQVYHGTNRVENPRRLAKNDIVVTTYNIVSREYENESTLFQIKWHRIILDEAHVIRNHKTKCSVAVSALKGRYRWALTGTPIHNKDKDLYAIIKFLKCAPFDDLAHWKKWIDNKSAGGMQRLQALIKSMMIRRTKVQLQDKGELMCLPEKSTTCFTVDLETDEMNVYQKILVYSRSLFEQFLHQKNARDADVYIPQKNKYSKMHQKVAKLYGSEEIKTFQILVLLLRLRQICVHPGLIDAMLNDDDLSGCDDSTSDHTNFNLVEHLENLQIKDDSTDINLEISADADSPSANAVTKASSNLLKKSNPVYNLERPSSKMKKIFEVLDEKILHSPDKAIIISQWTSVLNIIQTHLARRQIKCCALNGSIAIKDRNDIVVSFNNPKSPTKVMLLSLTAGGVGLNLVGANHLFLVDLHWNPQLECQAQDRIYRVGQTKNVNIYKFMCKDTIEERIKNLQDKKLEVAKEILTGERSGSKLTIEDLKSLFGL